MTRSADDLDDDNATGGKGRTGKGEDLPTIRRASRALATNGHDELHAQEVQGPLVSFCRGGYASGQGMSKKTGHRARATPTYLQRKSRRKNEPGRNTGNNSKIVFFGPNDPERRRRSFCGRSWHVLAFGPLLFAGNHKKALQGRTDENKSTGEKRKETH